MELSIKGLTKQFKDKTAVDHVDLTITPGVWGLLGANGAGKTTLMRMIAGLSRPTEGTVTYDGIEIGALGEKYRDLFGYLPQEFGFYPEFTVKEYLLYIASLKGIRPAVAKKRVKDLIDGVGLAKNADKKSVEAENSLSESSEDGEEEDQSEVKFAKVDSEGMEEITGTFDGDRDESP